jgi:hypothetical protein
VYGETCGSAPRGQRISVRFLWGYMKDLVYSIPIDTIEVLNEQVGNAATIIRNNGGMLERVEESFHRHLHYYIENNGGPFEHFV